MVPVQERGRSAPILSRYLCTVQGHTQARAHTQKDTWVQNVKIVLLHFGRRTCAYMHTGIFTMMPSSNTCACTCTYTLGLLTISCSIHSYIHYTHESARNSDGATCQQATCSELKELQAHLMRSSSTLVCVFVS